MASATETLRAIEARTGRVIVQGLQSMVQEVVGLRPHLTLDDRAHADALLLKPGRLPRIQVVAPENGPGATRQLMPARWLGPAMPSRPAYKVSHYNFENGDLTEVVTTDTFDAGVQLVRDRLPRDADYEIDATWTSGLGNMKVWTPRGTIVARVEAVNRGPLTVQPRANKRIAHSEGGGVPGALSPRRSQATSR